MDLIQGSRTIPAIFAVVVQLLTASPSSGHDPGLSTMAVRILDGEIVVRITLTRADLAGAFYGHAAAVADAVELWTEDGRLVALYQSFNDVDPVEIDLVARFPRPRRGQMRIIVPFLDRLAHGHRHYVTVDRPGATTASRLLSARDNELEVALPAQIAAATPP